MDKQNNALAEQQRLAAERVATVDRFFKNLAIVDKIAREDAVRSILSVLDHPGFAQLLGLIIGERNGLLLALANLELSSAEKIARASVLQGRVQGIDTLHRTLIEVANTSSTPAKEI